MILSIQSHVAYGRVGNRSAVFPLELTGHEVIAVNTVQFSNHTGYGVWRGEVFTAAHIRDVISGVEERGALQSCEAILSGYTGAPEIGEVILEAVTKIRSKNPSAVYCLDPVMGDYGRGFFVKPGLPEFFRDKALPLANIVTPNQFEAEYLSGMKISSYSDAAEACRRIKKLGPSVVLITSCLPDDKANSLSLYLSDSAGDHIMTTDRIPVSPEPNGAGDLTAALFLGRYLETKNAVTALELTVNAVYAVFEYTCRAKSRELRLVDARFDIMKPVIRFRARPANAMEPSVN